MKYIAHVKFNQENQAIEHLLEDHLQKVAKLAANNAQGFGASYWAELAGRWHDLGKYSTEFQDYIRDQSGYERENAHIEYPNMKGRINHSSAGALFATQQFKERFQDEICSKIIAYLIAGHHAGLADWSGESGQASLYARMQDTPLLRKALSNSPPKAILNFSTPKDFFKENADVSFWIRMLFSCLVDADFLDTERFMSPKRSQQRQSMVSLFALNQTLDQYLGRFTQTAPEGINIYRQKILEDCQNSAALRSGLFSLTVPTGGGKTLSSLSFALRHAIQHKKARIIYVIPYTSIIEQTAELFKQIFHAYPDAVLEHHSNFDTDSNKETAYLRLASENWGAPIIVTTAVQYFESLYASRSSSVRKLHNIVNSVVILDEAQLLPPDYLMPILHVIKELSQYYQVSHLLCTATQPALESQPKTFAKDQFKGLDRGSVQEIISHPDQLNKVFKRVSIILIADKITKWEQLLTLMLDHQSFLCIVDRRSDAQTLYQQLPPDSHTFHLSGLMCGQHRSDVIRQIKNQLKCNKPVKVISTQLIEAGVDIDFPIVFKTMAGLDSIAQAAGRCNREGRLRDKGKVFVFEPPKAAPVGHLRQAADIGRRLLLQPGLDPLSSQAFTTYFEQLYWLKGEALDKKNILSDDLHPNPHFSFKFRRAAKKFKLIENDYKTLLIPYGEGEKHIQRLRNSDKIYRELKHKLQRYSINIPSQYFEKLLMQDRLETCNGFWILIDNTLYHGISGLQAIDNSMNYYAEDLMV